MGQCDDRRLEHNIPKGRSTSSFYKTREHIVTYPLYKINNAFLLLVDNTFAGYHFIVS